MGMSCCNSILHLVEAKDENFSVCEIGVREGRSSVDFLEKGCFLYMIDPWIDYPEYAEKHYVGRYEEIYQATLEAVAPFEGKYKIIRKKSDDAVNDIPQVDLVWIDGNHALDFVKRDMENYWPKVKQDGWLTGDDYREVCPAVDEFCKNNNLKLELFGNNWAIKKI